MIIGIRLDREQIEDGIFDAINVVLADNNHYPDLKTIADQDAYNTAISYIKDTLGKDVIAVKNVSAPWRYQDDDYDQYIIEFRGANPGSIGKTAEFIEEVTPQTNPKTGEKFRIEGQTYDLEFAVRYITQSPKQSLHMEKMLYKALGTRKYIPALLSDDTYGQNFLIEMTNNANLSTEKEVEKVFTYMVQDVWLTEVEKVDDILDAEIHYDVDLGDGDVPQTPDYQPKT